MILTLPPNRQKFDDEKSPNGQWISWIGQTHSLLNTVVASGATRPTIRFVGQQFFDTSLGSHGKPIYANKEGTGWVLADGTTA